MATLSTLGASDLRAVIAAYASALRAHREVIDRLNVYPVPDGDTGTNMALTVASVNDELDTLERDAALSDVAAAIAHGALLGARGNSGVILAQLLRGLVADVPPSGALDAPALVAGLLRADREARRAVAVPVEGTILSVAHAAAEGARLAEGSLVGAARGAREAARVALAATTGQLDVLAAAGVVDAGGAGFVLFFEALCAVVAGDEVSSAPELAGAPLARPRVEGAALVTHYEVMFLLEASDDAVATMRASWLALGDSIVIVGGEGLFNCHVHTDDIGAAIEAGVTAGHPTRIRVSDLREQSSEEAWVHDADGLGSRAWGTAAVVVAAGAGLERLFRSLGASEIVRGGPSQHPSARELVRAVRATGAREVVLVVNHPHGRAVADQVDGLSEASVTVVPTRTVLEGLAALVAFNRDVSGALNAKAMIVAADRVTSGEITRALRDATLPLGDVHEGDWLGLGLDGPLVVASNVEEVGRSLLESLVRPEHELLTILEGAEAMRATTNGWRHFLTESFAHLNVEVHEGGQPLYPYLFGLE